MRADLHTHSSVSDGTQPPAELLAEAVSAGLDVIALTDHDTTAGWDEAALAARELGIGLIPGIEISTIHEGQGMHLLAYLVDPAHPGLTHELALAREDRDTRLARIVAAMAADGLDISLDAVREAAGDAVTLGRPHIADALVTAGVVRDRDEAFATYLSDSAPYYLPHYSPDTAHAIALVKDAGGVPVLAHPRSRTRAYRVGDAALERLADSGLAGVEVDHRDHDEADRAYLQDFAARRSLIATGSSDYHGEGKLNRLGENTTAPDQVAAILAAGTGIPPVL